MLDSINQTIKEQYYIMNTMISKQKNIYGKIENQIKKLEKNARSEKINIVLQYSADILKMKKEILGKTIKKHKENTKINEFSDALMLYNKLKVKLTNKIEEFNKKNNCFERNRGLNINEIIYVSIFSESLNTSFMDITNKLCIKKMIEFSANSLIDKKTIVNNNHELYDELISILLNFLQNEFGIEYNILAMDGSNLALNKKMSKYNYAYQSKVKTIDRNEIDKIKNEYKITIGTKIKDYNEKIKNEKKKEIKNQIKKEKIQECNKIRTERDKKYKI
jgi:hypothetical protein